MRFVADRLEACATRYCCRREPVRVERRHTHAGLREARRVALAPIRLLHVLAERELDALRRVLKLHSLGTRAVAQLDDLVLPTDGIRRAVEQIRRGQTAREFVLDITRLGIHHVTDADHRG